MKWQTLSITCITLAGSLHAAEEIEKKVINTIPEDEMMTMTSTVTNDQKPAPTMSTDDASMPEAINDSTMTTGDASMPEAINDPTMTTDDAMMLLDDNTLPSDDSSMDIISTDYFYTTTQSAEQLKHQFLYDNPYFEELSILQSEIEMLMGEDIDMLITSSSSDSGQDLQSFISEFQQSLQLNVMQHIDKLFAIIDAEPQLTLCQVLRSVFESDSSTPEVLANSLFSKNLEWDALFLIEKTALAKLTLNKQYFDQQCISETSFYKTNLLILLEKQAAFRNTPIPTQAPIHEQLAKIDQAAIEEASYLYDLALLKGYIAGSIIPETDTEQQIINCIVGLSSL